VAPLPVGDGQKNLSLRVQADGSFSSRIIPIPWQSPSFGGKNQKPLSFFIFNSLLTASSVFDFFKPSQILEMKLGYLQDYRITFGDCPPPPKAFLAGCTGLLNISNSFAFQNYEFDQFRYFISPFSTPTGRSNSMYPKYNIARNEHRIIPILPKIRFRTCIGCAIPATPASISALNNLSIDRESTWWRKSKNKLVGKHRWMLWCRTILPPPFWFGSSKIG